MTSDPLPPTKPPSKDGSGPKAGNPYALIGMGFELALIVTVLALGGRWLDEKFATSPGLLMAGLVLGFVGGFYRLWRKAMSKDD